MMRSVRVLAIIWVALTTLSLLTLTFVPGAAAAEIETASPARAPLRLEAPLQDKNFYLLSLIERNPKVGAAVHDDATLAELMAARAAAIGSAAGKCDVDLDCYAAVFQWKEQQIAQAGHALASLYRNPAVREWTDGALRSSGVYVRYNGMPGDKFLEHAWTDCAQGMNRIIDVYGRGKPPRYPAIDSITYDAASLPYRRLVQSVTALLAEDRANPNLFFEPSLRFALELMTFNHRDEAARYEPMEAGENAEAATRARSIDWSRYPFSAIIVPGAGNDRPGVRLSAAGKLRDEIAAIRFRHGQAPFLIVSGGFVHPKQTEYSEAIEMKHDLMTRFGIPANAIIVDPHARHTTTNLRNAARLIYRYGVPFDKKALVTTDLSQSQYIEAATFQTRCMEELGYSPFKLLRRVSGFDLEILPLLESLHIDPQDPLDP
jgi:hypothetical protein